ncbi:MAG: hypothetical protein ACK559_15710, partial [bacterium]
YRHLLLAENQQSRLLLSQVFQDQFHLNHQDVEQLYDYPFLFILDDYDKLEVKFYLHLDGELYKWFNSTFVILTRSSLLDEAQCIINSIASYHSVADCFDHDNIIRLR